MKGSNSLFLHRIFKGIGDSCLKVFIPLLIYQHTANFNLCLLYLCISYFLTSVLFATMKNPIRKAPLLFIILHILPLMATSVLLTLDMTILIVVALGVLDAVATTFYYAPLNLMFAFLDKNADTAKFEAGQNLGKIIFAFLGAFLLGDVKNSLVFVIIFSCVIYLISVIPLCLNYRDLKDIAKKEENQTFTSSVKNCGEFNLFHIFTGVFSFVKETFLPLYLYISGLSFSTVGYMVAIQYVLNILAGYVAKFADKKGKTKLSTIINSIVLFAGMIVVCVVKNSAVIYAFSLVVGFSYSVLFTSYFTKFVFSQTKKNNRIGGTFARDFVQNSARETCTLVCFIPFSFPIFIVGICSSVGIMLSGLKCDKVIEKEKLESEEASLTSQQNILANENESEIKKTSENKN